MASFKVQTPNIIQKRILDLIVKFNKLSLKELKDEYERHFCMDFPYSDDGDERKLDEWMSQRDNFNIKLQNGIPYYSFNPPEKNEKVDDAKVKRKTSPLQSSNQTPSKRSRSMPGKQDDDNEDLKMEKPQPRSVRFERTPRSTRSGTRGGGASARPNTAVTRSRSENRTPIVGTPHIYNSVLIADDFLIGLVKYDLNFRLDRRQDGKLCAGLCISGLTIAAATKHIKKVFDKKPGQVLIYLGSIDIISGRELVEMMDDINNLVKTCLEMNKKPTLCTLAPLPSHYLNNAKEILDGFNQHLKNGVFGVPVIDINKTFLGNETIAEKLCYDDRPQFITGTNYKSLVSFWTKEGRHRFFNMIRKNLGFAFNCTDGSTFSHI